MHAYSHSHAHTTWLRYILLALFSALLIYERPSILIVGGISLRSSTYKSVCSKTSLAKPSFRTQIESEEDYTEVGPIKAHLTCRVLAGLVSEARMATLKVKKTFPGLTQDLAGVQAQAQSYGAAHLTTFVLWAAEMPSGKA